MIPLLKTENLSVVYDLGKSSEKVALDNVNIEIYPKEYIILFGPSGSGKSTLLYTLAGLEAPTYGKVFLKNKSITGISKINLMSYQRRFIGMIFQAYYLIPSLSAIDNITLPQVLEEVPRKERDKKAHFLLKRFNISESANRFPQYLSGGQQQRVAISRALINNPVLILADEPVGNLDSKAAEQVMDLLRELNEKDEKTIILVTHDPRYLHYAHRLYHMEDGKIVQEVSNPERVQIKLGKIAMRTDLERLSRIFPYLPKGRLQAKALSFHLNPPLSLESQERFEDILEKYINHKITLSDFTRLLDDPYEKGGAGLYKQSAVKYSKQIKTIIEEAEKLRRQLLAISPEKSKKQKRVESLRVYLLDNYEGKIMPEQIRRLEQAIEERVFGGADRKVFTKNLDLSIKKGGVGLNRRTAKNFTRMLEVILAEAR